VYRYLFSFFFQPGRAIYEAALRFGDGRTLPYTPCKKGYLPVVKGQTRVACPLHEHKRRQRIQKHGVRAGEVDLRQFWKGVEETKEVKGASKEEKPELIAS